MRSLKLLALAVLLAAGVPAYAGPNDAAASAEFEQATKAYNLGHFDEAAVHYQAAYNLVRDPNLLFHIGRSYSLGGKHEQALSVFRTFLREAPPNAPDRPLAERFVEQLKRKVDDDQAAAAWASWSAEGHPVAGPAPAPASATVPAPAPAPPSVPAPGPAYVPAPAPAPVSNPTYVPAPGPAPAYAPVPSAPVSESVPAPIPQTQPLAPFAPAPQPWPTPAPSTSAPAADLLVNNPPVSDHTEDRPFYKTWWFWTAAGAVVVAGTVTALLLARQTPDACGGVGMDCMRVK